MSIIKALKKLKNSHRVFFTTPSHSRGAIVPTEIKNLLGLKAFQADFSEVDGLDNLRNPQACLLKSMETASKIYGTKKTFYLFNGSSSGIEALMLSILKEGDKVLAARNSHEAVYNGLVLTGAVPVWFLPDWNNEFDVAKGVTLEKIKQEYTKTPDIKALILTSPTYEGICSDIKEIAAFCKEKKIIFLVDEAHGALLPFSNNLPQSTIKLGADACIHSLHKNTPSLTGSALLHIAKNSVIDADLVQKNLNLLTTTSPSWLLIVAIEGAIKYLNSKKGQFELQKLIENIETLKKEHPEFNFLNAAKQDVTKLLFKKEGISGEILSKFLDKNNIEDELVTRKAVLCLCGIGTTKKKLKKLSKVLTKFSKKSSPNTDENICGLSIPKMKLLPKVAHFNDFEIVKKENSIGRIIAENITPYPPCIPVLIAGEIIEKEHLIYLGNSVKVVK